MLRQTKPFFLSLTTRLYKIIERIVSNNYQWPTKLVDSIILSNQGAGPNNIYMQTRPNQPPGFTQQVQKPPQAEYSNSLENLLKAYMVKNDALI
ncbi:transcription factor MYB34 [Gossypium australe]|uniref:Transcription factor MYB34 n=1 Tax=Gossypium australe TaxID=47621 RepID=A0A5B6X046_9ROSI|nr:transcription factor MYB34 [Gossypium australe]